MTSIVVGVADQGVQTELRSLIEEVEGATVLTYADTTHELSAYVARTKPEICLLHDGLGPENVVTTVRDITLRAPSTAVVLVSSLGDPAEAMAAMEAGAKSVLTVPIALEDVRSKLEDAASWSQRMGGLMSGAVSDTERELGRHGRVTVFAGSKGGVGTTTIATHMALDLRRRVPTARVCLVDLDLVAGDVSGVLEARQRVSIADVARVAEDLSAATILDALVQHESGVSLLLTPARVHESEEVTPGSVRAILNLLRREFDTVIVDGGSHVTPAQAAAVEVCDEVAVVVTPDVLSMRAYRRTVQAWEELNVRNESELHVVVNRASREDVLNADAMGKLTSARLVETRLPVMARRLERAVNARNPEEVRESAWWTGMERIGASVGVFAVPASARPAAGEAAAPAPSRRSRGRRRAELGQVALENAVLVPVVLLICLLVWQLVLTGLAMNWNSSAANAAARAYAVGKDPSAAARAALPPSMRDQVSVSTDAGAPSVRVSMQVPLVCAGCAQLPKTISQTVGVVREP